MPKMKKLPTDEMNLKIRAMIEKNKVLSGKSNRELSEELNMPLKTLYRRLSKPTDLSVREFSRITRSLNINRDEVMSVL